MSRPFPAFLILLIVDQTGLNPLVLRRDQDQDFSVFQDVLNSCTEGYDCLVLDNTSRSNSITDCVFWYRATPNRKFKIGSKDLWSYCKKNYDAKKAKEIPEFDAKKLKKKSAPSVAVKKLK